MARNTIDPNQLPPLPSDIAEDLRDAFSYYDKDNHGYVGAVHFKNILHNMGFHAMSKKDIGKCKVAKG